MRIFCDPSNQSGPSGRGLSTKDMFKRAAQLYERDFAMATEIMKRREQDVEERRIKELEVEALKVKLEAKKNESTNIGSLLSRLVGSNESTRTPKEQEVNALQAELANAEAELKSKSLSPTFAVSEQNPVKSVTCVS